MSDQQTPEAVEAVAKAMWLRIGGRLTPSAAAADALKFIRDAIHSDGAVADAIRDALGLRVQRWEDFAPDTDQPSRRVVGEWQEGR